MRKTIHSVPAVLAINTAISSQEHRRLWATPGWLPEEIGIIVDQGQFFCFEGEDLKLHLQRGMHNITVYSLIGMVVNIESSSPQKTHLVSVINGKSDFFRCWGFDVLTIDSCTRGCSTVGGEQVAPVQRLLSTAHLNRRSVNIQRGMEATCCVAVSSQSRKQQDQHGLENQAGYINPVQGSDAALRRKDIPGA
jgi:hypothetical protein